ncbi:pilus assembly protein PilM, partial [Candidatus Collierbacteria bacterium]|nr:pilus assembly protein PilM [Candidatus Collierbacteria bacterium]
GRVGVDLVPVELSSLTAAVTGLIEQTKIKTKKVVISIPESLVFTKIMQFPVMSSPELATAIKWEAEQAIPYPIDKLELSWVVLYKPKSAVSGEKMKVMVVGVPSKVSNSYVNFLDTIGLEPIRMENEILSMVRSLIVTRKLSGISMIIDIGHSTTKIVVSDGNEIFTNYVSPLGGGAFTKIIAVFLILRR